MTSAFEAASNNSIVTTFTNLFDTSLASSQVIPFCTNSIEVDMIVPNAGTVLSINALSAEGSMVVPYNVLYTITIYGDDPGVTTQFTTSSEGIGMVSSRGTTVGMYGLINGSLTDLRLKAVVRWPQGSVYAISRMTISAVITTRPSYDTGYFANPSTGAAGLSGQLRWDLTQANITLKCYKDTPAADDRKLIFYVDGLSTGHVVKIDAASSVSIMTNSSLAALTRRERRDVMIDPAIQSALGVLAASLPVASYEEVMEKVAEIASSPMMVDAIKGESAMACKTRRIGNAAFSFGGLLRMVKQAAPILQVAADVSSGVPIAGSVLGTLATASKYADHPLATAAAEQVDARL